MNEAVQHAMYYKRLMEAERDDALARADKAEHNASLLRLELANVLSIHKHDGPSSMCDRIERTLIATTPEEKVK